jgi:hypothetical protein
MKKATIKAISFLYKGERVIIRVNRIGKFKVPVSETIQGRLITRNKSLTAREFIKHKIIKDCDPTLYVEGDSKVRVYQGGSSDYLPAAVDGLITKHDETYIPRSRALGQKKQFTFEDLSVAYPWGQNSCSQEDPEPLDIWHDEDAW